MESHLFQGSSLLMMVVLTTLVLPCLSYLADPIYTTCGQSFQCGNIRNIGYPFWGGTRPKYCGHRSFQLTNCRTYDAPVIAINSVSYRVKNIDSTARLLRLVRDDYSNTICPDHPRNATIESDHFSYAADTIDMMLYYNCQMAAGGVARHNQFSCSVNGSIRLGLYAMNGTRFNDGVECSIGVRVQVGSTSNSTLFNVSQVVMAGFGLKWDANNTDCDKCIQAGGQCGSNSANDSFLCHPSEAMRLKDSSFMSRYFYMILTIIALTLMVYGSLCCFRSCYRLLATCLKRRNTENVEAFIQNQGSLAPKRYKYSDVKKMTNSFKDKIGQGGFGSVYKGKLSDGRLVAVKILSESKADADDFFNEVTSISQTSHVNVVTLLGFCYEKKKRALIYEFMVGGSLDKAIADGVEPTTDRLEWQTLYQIALGVARGLEYLHRGCNTRIVHFDIKPHNILLDENFHPKISDFGLAKICQSKQSKISMMGTRGTVGYIAPEIYLRAFGCVSHKSDVYSYGMLILEMTGVGKKKEGEGAVRTSELYFPDWIYQHLEEGKDFELDRIRTEEDEKTAKKMVMVGLWCIQNRPSDRPPMSEVVNMLEGDLESLEIPICRSQSSLLRPCSSSLEISSEALSSISNRSLRLGNSHQSVSGFAL